MKKTPMEIERDFFSMLAASPVAAAVTGSVYRPMTRPAGSAAEDIVVKFLSGTDGQIQTGVVVVNAYVPDTPLPDGRRVCDFQRVAAVERALLEFAEDNPHGEYRTETDGAMTLAEESEIRQHRVTARIRYKRYSD